MGNIFRPMKKHNGNPPACMVLLTLLFLSLGIAQLQAQKPEHPKVVLITLDGFRWQELFTGADPLLIANKDYVEDTMALKERFWRNTAEERREALMPFVWDSVVKMGQIHGNRGKGSKVDLTNKMWFSYPGYNEILSGLADDDRIVSNDKIDNPNITVLEYANRHPDHKGKVAAFGSWDVFPFIVNEGRSGVPVNAGFKNASGDGLSEAGNLSQRIAAKGSQSLGQREARCLYPPLCPGVHEKKTSRTGVHRLWGNRRFCP